ncbi:MAG: D-alanyl-D-alanine endopeptidase [Gammaproteobacteria bacterium]|nr:D-alanyl-D-alanine endopeptidase [Gammaproteobacteria bacterium]
MLGKLKVLPLAIALILSPGAGATTTEAPPKPAAVAPAKPGTPTDAKSPAAKAAPRPAAKTAAAGGKPAAPQKAAAAKPAAPARPAAAKPVVTAKSTPSKGATAATASKGQGRVARTDRVQPAPARVARAEEGAPPVAGREHWVNVESHSAMVVDSTGREIYSKNPDEVMPIASITKLMTAMVVLDAQLPLDEVITVEPEDRDYLRNTYSRLQVGRQLTRRDMLHIALMSSENRAAAALGRAYPGGKAAFIRAMNAKARALGMSQTRFYDSTGLDGSNVSTARDLVRLALAAGRYPIIREATTTSESAVLPLDRGTPMLYRNSNRLVRGGNWEISLSKTGYLNEAGRCLVMQAEVQDQPLVFVFLHGPGKLTPMGDASRIRAWLERGGARTG